MIVAIFFTLTYVRAAIVHDAAFWTKPHLVHYENKLIPKTLYQQIYTKYFEDDLKFTKYLVNVHKLSYHQKGVKHYILTNWNQITPI